MTSQSSGHSSWYRSLENPAQQWSCVFQIFRAQHHLSAKLYPSSFSAAPSSPSSDSKIPLTPDSPRNSGKLQHRTPDHQQVCRLALQMKANPDSLRGDRKSTRLNSSHVRISYAVFCLKKKKQQSK